MGLDRVRVRLERSLGRGKAVLLAGRDSQGARHERMVPAKLGPGMYFLERPVTGLIRTDFGVTIPGARPPVMVTSAAWRRYGQMDHVHFRLWNRALSEFPTNRPESRSRLPVLHVGPWTARRSIHQTVVRSLYRDPSPFVYGTT